MCDRIYGEYTKHFVVSQVGALKVVYFRCGMNLEHDCLSSNYVLDMFSKINIAVPLDSLKNFVKNSWDI